MRPKQHLEQSNTTYFEHAKWAVVAALQLFFASVASLLHAIYPGWFTGTSARTVIRLYHQRLIDHPNREYQAYIKSFQDQNGRSDDV